MKRHLIGMALAAVIGFTSCAQGIELTTQQQAAIDNIMTRTSIRSWEDKAVPAELVDVLLRAGMAAPTAVNRQPWHFVVINSKEKLAELAGDNPRGGMLKKAPLAIVVCGNMDKALPGQGNGFWVQDCSAATENILLAANAIGLGAVWTGLYPDVNRAGAVAKVLKLPETFIPLCTIVIGHPAEQPAPKDKWKPENYRVIE